MTREWSEGSAPHEDGEEVFCRGRWFVDRYGETHLSVEVYEERLKAYREMDKKLVGKRIRAKGQEGVIAALFHSWEWWPRWMVELDNGETVVVEADSKKLLT